MDTPKNPGDKCTICDEERLVVVNGALVCPKCDCVHLWPSQRKR